MAVNSSRSMNDDLKLGQADGLRKNLTPDRGGEAELSAVQERAGQLQPQYGLTNGYTKSNPNPYN